MRNNFCAYYGSICVKMWGLVNVSSKKFQLLKPRGQIFYGVLQSLLVHSCILSKMDYCNSLYFNLPLEQIQKLQRLMNACVRFIFRIKQRKTSITSYLKKAHILPVLLRIRFKICVTVFKCINELAPSYLCKLISKKFFAISQSIPRQNTTTWAFVWQTKL